MTLDYQIAVFRLKRNFDCCFADSLAQSSWHCLLEVGKSVIDCVAVHYDCDATNFQCAHEALPKVYLIKEPLPSLRA